MTGQVRYLAAIGAMIALLTSAQPGARAETERPQAQGAHHAATVVSPCARSHDAPVPLPGEARGWAVPPAESYRRETRWLKQKTKEGVKYTLQTVFAPFESALWLNRRFAVVRRVEDVLYLGSDARTYGVLPAISFQSGFGTAIGANAFHKSIFGNRERLALKASYGGRFDRLAQLSLDAPQVLDGKFYVEGVFRYEGKSEIAFYGIGNADDVVPADGEPTFDPRDSSAEAQFRQQRMMSALSTGAHFGGPGMRVRVGLSLVYNTRDFDQKDEDEEGRDIGEVYDTSLLVGFDEGEDITEVTADLIVDTRDYGGNTGGGGLVDFFIGGAPSFDGNLFLHYGFEVSYFLTLFRRGRVLMARAMLESVDGDRDAIPFTELPRLGGASRLRGYPQDRFREELAVVGTLEYRYPIHHTLSGMFFVEAGKVTDSYAALVGREFWHPSFGGGLVAHTLTDVSFRLDLSYGEGFEVFFSSDALAAFRDRRREL